jgi:cleavage stimulation factor subunit 3
VEQGRGGAVTPEEAFTRFLERFPLAFKVWRQYADFYKRKQDYKQAETIYLKCLDNCRSVQLWVDYLNMLRFTSLEKLNKNDEKQYGIARQFFESAIERAIESVGMSSDATSLWRLYIDFVRDYPELGSADPGRKIQALRKIYQHAICIPMADTDSLWREYEALEKSAGEHLADRVLPEHKERLNHAKAIFKEREKITAMIVFDRLAVPSGSQSGSFEYQQLDMWNRWIRLAYPILNSQFYHEM